jgi:hypothetical protein
MKLFSFFRKKNKGLNKSLEKGRAGKQEEPQLPEFEEIFEVVTELLIIDPFDSSEDSIIQESELKEILLTLIVGLREHLKKVFENPSDQHKSMEQVGKYLEAAGVKPIAYTQWNQSSIQGLAARIILHGKVRTALFGHSHALVRNTAPMRAEILEVVERATASGNNVYILAIDGLAYGVYEVSHRLQEIVK